MVDSHQFLLDDYTVHPNILHTPTPLELAALAITIRNHAVYGNHSYRNKRGGSIYTGAGKGGAGARLS